MPETHSPWQEYDFARKTRKIQRNMAYVETLRFEKKPTNAINVNSLQICKLKDKQIESI
jgi:hypothetical protein